MNFPRSWQQFATVRPFPFGSPGATFYALTTLVLALVICLAASAHASGDVVYLLVPLILAVIAWRRQTVFIALPLFLAYVLGDISGREWLTGWSVGELLEGQLATLALILVIVSLRYQSFADGIFPTQVTRARHAWWPSRKRVTRLSPHIDRRELPSLVIVPVGCFLLAGFIYAWIGPCSTAASSGLIPSGLRGLKLVLLLAGLIVVVHGLLTVRRLAVASPAEKAWFLQQEMWHDLRRETCTAARVDERLQRRSRRAAAKQEAHPTAKRLLPSVRAAARKW
jgi:hypothetical protein